MREFSIAISYLKGRPIRSIMTEKVYTVPKYDDVSVAARPVIVSPDTLRGDGDPAARIVSALWPAGER